MMLIICIYLGKLLWDLHVINRYLMLASCWSKDLVKRSLEKDREHVMPLVGKSFCQVSSYVVFLEFRGLDTTAGFWAQN